MKMKCTDDVISLRRMVSPYANTYHVIAIISLYHEISNDTDLNISFVRFEPRTQHPVCDVVSPCSYRHWAVVSSGTGNQFVTTICTCIVTLMKRVHWLCVQLPKLKIGFWLFVKKSRLYDIKGVFWFFEAVYL